VKVAFVVQRCGREVHGGAETLCLTLAQRMARYWETTVLTTCALDYMRWDNYYPEGDEVLAETVIRRFPVDHPRDVARFDAFSQAVCERSPGASLEMQEEWMTLQGPISSKLLAYLTSESTCYDLFIFFGYLYATTYFGLPRVADRALLAPLAHDEWPIHLSMWDDFFKRPNGFIFQTEEEKAFLERRFSNTTLKGPVAGIGIEAPPEVSPESFREQYDLQKPFILYAGRIDASKGCGEMFEYFLRMETEPGAGYDLVTIGKEVLSVPFHDRIIHLGFVSEEDKWNAMAACEWLILPSPFESLSISLLEGWVMGRPAIVSAKAEVLQGHCRRSNGGLWYRNYAEFATILGTVSEDVRRQLGAAGHRYVTQHYVWSRIEAIYLAAFSGPILCERSEEPTAPSPDTN
jgi:glycosyltransferase involved in cell wall biosynthesis